MVQVHLVERDPNLALLYHEELEEAGFRVRVHQDLGSLLSAGAGDAPHILVTDLASVGPNPDIWLPSVRNFFTGPVVALADGKSQAAKRAGLPVVAKTSDLKPLIQSLRGYALKMAWSDSITPTC